MKKKSKYLYKLQKNIVPIIQNIKNPKILELGVRNGVSTNFFLEYCEKNDGKLYSVDIDDCSKISSSNKWKFIHSRDDEYNKIIKETGSNFDLIYIDSFHNANHVCKIIYLYFMDLKKKDTSLWMILAGYFIAKTMIEIILIRKLIIMKLFLKF